MRSGPAVLLALLGLALPAQASAPRESNDKFIDHGVVFVSTDRSIPLTCAYEHHTSATAPGDERNGDTIQEKTVTTTVLHGGETVAQEPSSAADDGSPQCNAPSYAISEPGRYDVSTATYETHSHVVCDNNEETGVCRPPTSDYNYGQTEDDPGYPRSTTETWSYVVPGCSAVRRASGTVSFAEGDTGGLQKGDEVAEGSVVSTGPNGHLELVLADKSVVRLGPGSKLRIDDCAFSDEGRSFRARLLLGKMWNTVSKVFGGDKPNYEIDTQRATAGVRGTAFSVEVGRSRDTVEVTRGSVWTTNRRGRKRTLVVKAGHRAVVGDHGPPRLTR